MINEDSIISYLQERFGSFIGDDGVQLPTPVGGSFVITKDVLVEDVHFRTKYFLPEDLAYKALNVNLSDLAAMGAIPRYILCGISIPPSLLDYTFQMLKSLTQYCSDLHIALIGGDTTASRDKLFISITAIGEAQTSGLKYRSSCKEGDIICVVGNIGLSHLGWQYLEQQKSGVAKYVSCFLRPKAKNQEGIWLSQQVGVSSMMDISDGLYIDLQKLCRASHKGAVVDLELLQQHLEPAVSVQIALEGGEDYSLLCTITPTSFERLSQQFIQEFDEVVKVIGHITKGERVELKKGGKNIGLDVEPFEHFGEVL